MKLSWVQFVCVEGNHENFLPIKIFTSTICVLVFVPRNKGHVSRHYSHFYLCQRSYTLVPVWLFVHQSVCLIVNRTSQKCMGRNFVAWQALAQETTYQILAVIWLKGRRIFPFLLYIGRWCIKLSGLGRGVMCSNECFLV